MAISAGQGAVRIGSRISAIQIASMRSWRTETPQRWVPALPEQPAIMTIQSAIRCDEVDPDVGSPGDIGRGPDGCVADTAESAVACCEGETRCAQIPHDARRSRWMPRYSARSAIAWSMTSPPVSNRCREARSRAAESPSAIREALGLDGPLPEDGTDPASAAGARNETALRQLAVQRASALLRLHHLVASARSASLPIFSRRR